MSNDVINTPVHQLIAAEIERRGLTWAKLSRLMGRNSSYLFQFLKRGSPVELHEKDRKVLAGVLGLDENLLRINTTDVANAPVAGIVSRRVAIAGSKDLPLHRVTSRGRQTVYARAAKDVCERPPVLVDAPNAFAILIAGDDLDPIWRVGDTVYFDPESPLRAGDGAAVTTPDGIKVGIFRGYSEGGVMISTRTNQDGAGEEIAPYSGLAREVCLLRR
jgi:hypothetical protein